MNIIVCLKRVPDTGARLEIDKDGLELKPDFPWILNPYDEFAIEEAIRIKERFGGNVTLITVGPEGGEEVLKRGVATGADFEVYVKDPRLRGLDEINIARVLSAAISPIPFDMILCGKQGTDSDSGVVGGALAGMLDIPFVSAVKRLNILPEERRVQAFREVEGGTEEGGTEVVDCPLPALFTTHKGLNEPRYPTLSGIMRAKKQEIRYLDLNSIGIAPGHFSNRNFMRVGLSYPLLNRRGVILKGDIKRQVQEAVMFLKDEVRIL